MKYREAARLSLSRAKNELCSEDTDRFRYAALDLRMALEALVYERATLYKEEITKADLKAWQPKKLLSILLEIDPDTDQTVHWSIGKQPAKGLPPKNMQELGEDRRLSLSEIKKYYDRLGSYLHNPTLEQLAERKIPEVHKIKERCLELADIIEAVLESPIFNTRIKGTVTFNCLNCGEKVIRSSPPGIDESVAACKRCDAQYSIEKQSQNTVIWSPIYEAIKCANKYCDATFDLFEVQIKEGTRRKCPKCGDYSVIKLALVHEGSSPR